MHRILGRAITVGGFLVVAFVSTVVTAFAFDVYGGYTSMGNINGRDYQNRSMVSDTSGGYAEVTTVGTAQAPTGHLGAQASLWKSGALCKDTGWYYNQFQSGGAGFSTGLPACGAGNYQGDGQVRVYRPSTGNFVTGYPTRSPYLYIG